AEDRRSKILLGISGEVEEVGIHAELRAFGEEAWDERCLPVQIATGRGGEEARGAFAEIGGGHGFRPARDEVAVAREPSELVYGGNDALVIEGDLVRDPLVVNLRRLSSKHHIFDPVGRGPARCTAIAETYTPGRGAIRHDLLREGLQLLHRLVYFLSRILEIVGNVPD